MTALDTTRKRESRPSFRRRCGLLLLLLLLLLFNSFDAAAVIGWLAAAAAAIVFVVSTMAGLARCASLPLSSDCCGCRCADDR
jgi:hypothetical protein